MRALGLATLALLAACADSDTTSNGTCASSTAVVATEVLLDYYSYIPRCFSVTTGTKVTFVNLDLVPHTVTTAADQVETFDSGSVVPGGVFEHVFAVDGDIALHCSMFPVMTATAFVRAP